MTSWMIMTLTNTGSQLHFMPAAKLHYPQILDLVDSPEDLYLIYPSRRYPWDIQQLAALAQQRSDLTVVVKAGRVIGFANLYQVEVGESAFIGNIIIDKNERGLGLGGLLTLYMMQICQDKYQACPHLSVFAYNHKAKNLYQKLGFKAYASESRLNLSKQSIELVHMCFSDTQHQGQAFHDEFNTRCEA